MKQALLTSFATRFDYLMFGDEVVVRNYKKVIALFEVHFKECPEEIQHILADPEFDGMKAKEQILWSTDLFETKAVQLSTLEGDERIKYQEILNKELESIKEVLITLPYDVASFLLKAITYHDESTVFCAEDKVVITEWGMRPKGEFAVHMLSLEGVRPKPPVTPIDPSSNQPMGEEEPEEVPEDTPSTDDVPMVDDANTEPEPENVDVPEEPVIEEVPATDNESPTNSDGEEKKGNGKKKRWWMWLLLGLLFLIILLLLMRRCGKDDTSTPLPPVEEEDLEWEGDVQIVNNRLILLFSDQKSVDEFVKAFRDRYPDKKKYQLFIPDHHLPRVELLLPANERVEMMSRLTEEFRDFDLLVIPVSVIGMDKTFTDPAFKDPKKSWYFDMIKVSNAWDYTTGNPDLIVAVIDDGFDLNHPELKNKDIVKPYNAVTHNTKVFPVPNSGHGTHVASTVVGLADNGEGSAGIAPSCKLMPIQVANKKGIMTTSSIVDGVLHAIVNGADVVNMSLGKQFSSALAALPVNAQKQAIATQFLEEEQMWKKIFNMGMSNGKDIAFVIAGGNFNILVGIDPMQRVPGTIRVSAVDPSKKKASFSNFGEYSVLSAPGVDIYNAVSGSKKYDVYSGTSMSSPMVAGAFALMKSQYPTVSTADIAKVLQYTGIPSLSKVGNIINFADAFNYMETHPGEIPSPNTPSPNDPNDPNNPLNPNNPESPLNPKNPESPLNPGNPQYPLDPPASKNPNDPYNPTNPNSPLNPTNPNSPLNPTNPNSPLNPNNPGSPYNPTNPVIVDPTDPNSPLNPKNPTSPLNPENPNSPLNPNNPLNPENPLNPNNPKSPLNPTNPKSPLNPTNPNSPINPGYPYNPIDPYNPNRPNPNSPNNPYNPTNPNNPISPTNPNSPFNPTNPNSPFNPYNPKSPYNPTNPNSPFNPNNPGYSPDPTNPNSPYNPTNPNSPFNPKNPTSPLNPSNPTSPLNPDYPGNVITPNPVDPNDPCPDCTEAQRRYEELIRQLEELKKANPGCY